MDLARQALSVPRLRAKFAPVYWEPLAGSGERVVGILLIEPTEDSTETLSMGAHVVMSRERLAVVLGSRRARAAHGVLKEAAEYFTQRMRAGIPLDELAPLFGGFVVGTVRQAKGYSADQLLDVAVRSVSVFGSADEIVDTQVIPPRHTHATREFLAKLKRLVVEHDSRMQERFNKTICTSNGTSVTIDYAAAGTLVQAVSLPISDRTRARNEIELAGKLFELQFAREEMDGNATRSLLLMNTAVLAEELSASQRKLAESALQRGETFAKHSNTEVFRVDTGEIAKTILLSLG